MALDSITGLLIADRILMEIGKKEPGGDLPPEWWIDAINESVDNVVIQLRNIAGAKFAEESTVSLTLIVPSDDCDDDDTANWTDVNGTLSDNGTEYTFTVTTGASVATFTDEAELTVGKKYRSTVQVKDGTGAGSTVRINALTNADVVIENGTSITVSAAFAEASVEWIATETNNKVQIEIVANTVSDGETVLFDEIEVRTVGELDVSSKSIVPWGNPYEEPKDVILYVKDNSGTKVEWMDPRNAQKIADIPDYDNLKFYYWMGNIIYIALGDGATVTGSYVICHLKRRTAITTLAGTVDLDREFIPIVRAEVKAKALERLQTLGEKVQEDDLAKAKKAHADKLAQFGVTT